MFNINKNIAVIFCATLVTLFIFGSTRAAGKTFTIGVTADVSSFTPAFEKFKEGMAEFGYIDGKNIKYIFNGVFTDNEKMLDAETRKLLDNDVDMLLTFGNNSTSRAKKAVQGTSVPVVMCLTNKPIEQGFVETFKHPGGNVTGVKVSEDIVPKALQWLARIIPDAKKAYVPYNPDDKVSQGVLAGLDKIAAGMGINLVLIKTHSIEAAITSINKLPKNSDAIFFIPSPTLAPGNRELSQAAMNRRIPMVSAIYLNEMTPVSFANDLPGSGKQAARMANEIIKGTSPADLPVETSEVDFTISIKAAKAIGLNIPDTALAQANKIIH